MSVIATTCKHFLGETKVIFSSAIKKMETKCDIENLEKSLQKSSTREEESCKVKYNLGGITLAGPNVTVRVQDSPDMLVFWSGYRYSKV